MISVVKICHADAGRHLLEGYEIVLSDMGTDMGTDMRRRDSHLAVFVKVLTIEVYPKGLSSERHYRGGRGCSVR